MISARAVDARGQVGRVAAPVELVAVETVVQRTPEAPRVHLALLDFEWRLSSASIHSRLRRRLLSS